MKDLGSPGCDRNHNSSGPTEKARMRYYDKPDHAKPPLDIPPEIRERIFGRLCFLYGEAEAKVWMPELEKILRVHYAHKPQEMIDAEKGLSPAKRFSEKDIFLITYGDMIAGEEHSPLATLAKFVDNYYSDAVNTIHILPFFPYSSDRGFSIIDFTTVDPNLGTWEDIGDLADRYQLMFDGVLNHVSCKSAMFQGFLDGRPEYKNFFISYASPDDLSPDHRSKIFRPRTSDILSEFQTVNGPKYIWTTFSRDQIDLNFANPKVLMWIIDVLFLYARKGARILRLDAVTFIWKEPGTACVHLPQTHAIIKLIRDILSVAAPEVALITETNVPHKDNISYFGNGRDEAHMVYNFALPPLVLHTFYTGTATALSEWAQDLKTDSDTATFFNMLDTHDGIGLMGVKAILSKKEIDFIIQRAVEHGAYISYKTGEDGSEEPYEINTTWFSAINRGGSDEDITLQVRRFVASRSIALVIPGVPATYAHSFVGTTNDREIVKKTKSNRDINRGSIDSQAVAEAAKDPDSKFSLIHRQLTRLHFVRARQRAFHPNGDQLVLMILSDVFSVLRTSPEGDQHILALTNVTNKESAIEIALADVGIEEISWRDLLSERDWVAENRALSINMQPYEIIWLKPHNEMGRNISL